MDQNRISKIEFPKFPNASEKEILKKKIKISIISNIKEIQIKTLIFHFIYLLQHKFQK